ncbi:MAG: DegT/DnrJ/EryC1/StrS family aminotransferase [Crocinitomicaceae bacterium]|nr:DegT/DnrJ/EryC1/StrS family aminotransferase [Crocinitomicaceae bacterium]
MSQRDFTPLMVPDIIEKDINEVVNVLKSKMLVQGVKVQELETKISEYLKVKHAIAVSNGTASLHLALVALGIEKGDEVIVPALSYIASANVIELVGAKPIFVDVVLDNFNIDVRKVEAKITNKTKAILTVHEFGLCSNLTALKEISDKYKLYLIEDSACALGAKHNEYFSGTIGDIGSFSFHPRKAITSGEGGLVVTNNDDIAKKIRSLRNHGIEIIDNKMEFPIAGFNYRLTDIQAALVLSQFERFNSILAKKKELARIYTETLKDCKNIVTPKLDDNHTWQTYHVVVDKRDDVILQLKEAGIGSNYGAQCIPNEIFYKNKYQLDSSKEFPNALKANTNGLALPLYERLSEKDIIYIAKKLVDILNKQQI